LPKASVTFGSLISKKYFDLIRGDVREEMWEERTEMI
jgi:hypothetical protein